ncbi:hypothetical protein PPSQR21_038320 [Paenibacillus polymyxa SQR-21]|uniref:hypothetical protein n=1 Tax=Paenibacillus polymyxa TaxID=1406 RepID=UPI00042E4219|nr:hypothetical protein [Paenibacillus polymyxa]AHM67470.1 hypothetical protein PPSQR21_038320 [Paenibacillus polymyxa SQR-21]
MYKSHLILLSIPFTLLFSLWFYGFCDLQYSFFLILPLVFIGFLIATFYIVCVLEDIDTVSSNRFYIARGELDSVEPLSFQKYLRKDVYTLADVLVILFYWPLWVAAFVVYVLYLVACFYFRQLVKLLSTVVYVKVKKGVSK